MLMQLLAYGPYFPCAALRGQKQEQTLKTLDRAASPSLHTFSAQYMNQVSLPEATETRQGDNSSPPLCSLSLRHLYSKILKMTTAEPMTEKMTRRGTS